MFNRIQKNYNRLFQESNGFFWSNQKFYCFLKNKLNLEVSGEYRKYEWI